jgi:uncharacterized protein
MLLDTSGLMCLLDQRDIRHPKATKFFDTASQRISHNYVFAEFVALTVTRRVPKTQGLQFIDAIARSLEVEVVWVDEALHDRAMLLLFERPDKSWSLCDAISFIIINDNRDLEALTTDHHFEQAGFVRLLDG